MAIKNVGGHGTTSVLGQHGGQSPIKATPPFKHNTGSAGYKGTAPKGGGFKMSGGGKKKNSPFQRRANDQTISAPTANTYAPSTVGNPAQQQ